MAALSETALVHHPDETLTSPALALSTDLDTAAREAAAFELRHAFCAHLKASREHRGVSLQTISESTKVSESLFADLERCDVSRWPTGIYRRAFFREYTAFVGLHGESMLGEFIRLFPEDLEQVSSELRVPGPLRWPAPPSRRTSPWMQRHSSRPLGDTAREPGRHESEC